MQLSEKDLSLRFKQKKLKILSYIVFPVNWKGAWVQYGRMGRNGKDYQTLLCFWPEKRLVTDDCLTNLIADNNNKKMVY